MDKLRTPTIDGLRPFILKVWVFPWKMRTPSTQLTPIFAVAVKEFSLMLMVPLGESALTGPPAKANAEHRARIKRFLDMNVAPFLGR